MDDDVGDDDVYVGGDGGYDDNNDVECGDTNRDRDDDGDDYVDMHIMMMVMAMTMCMLISMLMMMLVMMMRWMMMLVNKMKRFIKVSCVGDDVGVDDHQD